MPAASASLLRALEIAPDSVACLLLAVEIDLELRRRTSARSSIERALALAPENSEAHVPAAIVELHARNRYRARSHLRTSLELDPENTTALNELGVMEDSDDNTERTVHPSRTIRSAGVRSWDPAARPGRVRTLAELRARAAG